MSEGYLLNITREGFSFSFLKKKLITIGTIWGPY